MNAENADLLRVRAMAPHEIAIAIEWAAAEGWNPGLSDAACFTTVDPGGSLLGEIEGEPAAMLSVVNYDNRFSFLGVYIVRPDQRGRGYGWRFWQAGMAHAGGASSGSTVSWRSRKTTKSRGSPWPTATFDTAAE